MSGLRRDFLKLGGGAAAGVMFTPLPWRLLGDASMWTQNWGWLPKLPRGPVTDAANRCTLCRAACPVRARCAGGVPTGLWPADRPLCAAGFAAHHFAYHPARLRTPSSPVEMVVNRLKARGLDGLAVLDLAPGRTGSLGARHLLSRIPGAVYLEAPAIEGATAAAVAKLLAQPAPLALDLAGARTLLSVRTPVMEGWASPRLVNAGPLPFRLLQADTHRTHTAELADEWIEVQDEAGFLLAVANELLKARPAAGAEALARAAAQRHHPAAARVARQLLEGAPAAVVADGDPANGPLDPAAVAVAAAINVLLGSPMKGGFAPRAEPPVPAEWTPVAAAEAAALPERSIRTLLIDEPLPGAALDWDMLRPKLANDVVAVGLAWSAEGIARRAAHLLPAPVFLETVQDAPPAVDAVAAEWGVSRPMLTPPAGALDLPALLGKLLGAETSAAEFVEARVKLAGGDSWTGAAAETLPRAARLLPEGMTTEALLAAPARRAPRDPGWRPAAASPLVAKLWKESELRRAPGERLS